MLEGGVRVPVVDTARVVQAVVDVVARLVRRCLRLRLARPSAAVIQVLLRVLPLAVLALGLILAHDLTFRSNRCMQVVIASMEDGLPRRILRV